MKRVIAVAFACLGVTGCFFEEDHGAFRATWAITQDGAATTCQDVGAVTVEVVSTRRSNGDVFIDQFDCFDFQGITAGLRTGTYDVAVRLLDADDEQLSDDITVQARVFSDEVTNLGNFEFAFGAGAAQGRFAATWIISVNGSPSSCATVGAKTFQIKANLSGGGTMKTFDFPCTAMTATTELIPAGTYVVSVNLLDQNGGMLNSVPVGATVPLAANETKNLGDFEFAFTYRDAALKVHMGSASVTGGNCAATNPNNGAGVVQQEIRVASPSLAQCLLFDIRGLVEAGQPRSGTTCTPAVCQEETTAQRIAGLQNGQYVVQVFGYKGATGNNKVVCYMSSLVPFTINGANVDLGTILAPFDESMDPQHLCNATKPL